MSDKVKEIEVWVNKWVIENGIHLNGSKMLPFPSSEADEDWVQATLHIQIPERKITISESEFDEALRDARSQYRDTSDCIWHLKQKLFWREGVKWET